MISASDKYKEFFSLLDDWKIKLSPLQQVISGKYEITQDAAFAFTQATCAFNRETYDLLRRTACFVLSFPPHLVREYIKKFGLNDQSLVLDPFCGTGTTIVECKKNGIPT